MLDIQPMSMRRVDPLERQQRAQLCVELVTTIVPLIPQTPYVNWAQILDLIGQANNLPDFARMILNPQGMMLIQANMQPGTMGSGGPWPQQAPAGNPMMQQAAGGAPVGVMPNGGAGPIPAMQQPGMMSAATPASQAAQTMLGKRFGGSLATVPGSATPWGAGPR